MEHMDPKAALQTLIAIDIKVMTNQFITIQITEDPNCLKPLNFHDIRGQMHYWLKSHNQHLGGSAEELTVSSDMLDAIEFKVKRELQIQNMIKYH